MAFSRRGPLPARTSVISLAAALDTASTSLPSTFRAGTCSDSARGLAPWPAVIGADAVVAEIWLSSQMKSMGRW